jgi:multiple antibiotic resistance protein
VIALSTLITIVNPVGAIGPFLAMTTNDSVEKRRRIALKSSVVCLAVLVGCAVSGSFIFEFFGFTIHALKIAGGLLLSLMAIDMLNARQSRIKATDEEELEGAQKDDVAVFPLGIPLLAGPGAIASVILLVDRARTTSHMLQTYIAILITVAATYILLRQANRISKVLGQTGVNILSRLEGLVLAAIAMQFIIDGLRDALPGLRG